MAQFMVTLQSKQFDIGNSTFYKMKRYQEQQNQILDKWKGVQIDSQKLSVKPQPKQEYVNKYEQAKYPEFPSEYRSQFFQQPKKQQQEVADSFYTIQPSRKTNQAKSVANLVLKDFNNHELQTTPLASMVSPLVSMASPHPLQDEMLSPSQNNTIPSKKFQNSAQQILAQSYLQIGTRNLNNQKKGSQMDRGIPQRYPPNLGKKTQFDHNTKYKLQYQDNLNQFY